MSGQRSASEPPESAPMEFAVGVHPLQSTSHCAGPFDVGVGYRLEGPSGDIAGQGALHGPELELGLYPVRHETGASSTLRAGLFTELSWLSFDDFAEETGFGVSLGGVVELTGFSEGGFASDDTDGFAAGVVAGQWAIGLYLAASYRTVGPTDHFITSFGFSGRIPFLAGVICCVSFDPDEASWQDSTTGSEEGYEDSAPQPSSQPRRQARPERARSARKPAAPVQRKRAEPRKEPE